MKQVTITTGKATIVVVDCKTKSVVRDEGKFYSVLPVDGKGFYPSKKNYRYLGTPSHLTEEDWKDIVNEEEESDIEDHRYAIVYPDYTDEEKAFSTATESGLSLLKANGVVMEQPERPSWITEIKSPEDRDRSQKQMEDFFEAQSKVWLNPQIFVKL